MSDSDDTNLPEIGETGERIGLGVKSELLPAHSQNIFNTAGAAVYAARFKGAGRADLLGYVCNTGLPPRADILPQLKGLDHPSFLRLIDFGPIQWPEDGKRYFAFTIERPNQPRFVADHHFVRQPLTEDFLIKNFIQPLGSFLMMLSYTGVAHGQIRLNNIFWRDTGNQAPQIGECISTPIGVGQPGIFEPLERALCPPAGRGAPTISDDCHALGICIAMLLLGQNPLRGLDDFAVNKLRMEKGTYNALLSNQRVSSGMLELLRGVLTDDPRQRWKPEDIEMWLSGRRLTPRPAETARRGNRPLTIAAQDYFYARPLAITMAENTLTGVQLHETGELERWLKRALGDEERAHAASQMVEAYRTNLKGQRREDLYMTFLCSALDPTGPFYLRNQRILPGGIATTLAEAVRTGGSIQPIADLINSQIITPWLELQGDHKTDLVSFAQTIERMRPIMEKTSYGYGPERVAYELNPSLPCLSPLLQGNYVNHARDLLPVLERTASGQGRPREPMDRHLAAWLGAREKRGDRFFAPLNNGDPLRVGLTLAQFYADMQYRHGPEKLPGMANWLLPLLEPATRRFRNRNLQEEVRKALRAAADKGLLSTMLQLADDSALLERDAQEYEAARLMYQAINQEIAICQAQIQYPDEVAIRYGRPAASYIGSVIAAGVGVISVMRALFG